MANSASPTTQPWYCSQNKRMIPVAGVIVALFAAIIAHYGAFGGNMSESFALTFICVMFASLIVAVVAPSVLAVRYDGQWRRCESHVESYNIKHNMQRIAQTSTPAMKDAEVCVDLVLANGDVIKNFDLPVRYFKELALVATYERRVSFSKSATEIKVLSVGNSPSTRP